MNNSKTFLTWAAPGALVAAMLLAGCGGGGGGGGGSSSPGPSSPGGTVGGGGTTTGGGGGGGTTTGGALTLTATAPSTPGHGYIAVALPSSTAATYTLQRAPAGTTSFATVASGLAGGTTYDDFPTGGTTDPAIGHSYIYQVVSSGSPAVTSAATPSVSPVGPVVAALFEDTSGNTLPYTAAPFTQNTSGIDFRYLVNTSNTPSVVMTIHLDYAPTASDVQSVTIDGNTANPNSNFYTPSQLGAAFSISGNVITVNTANLPANSGVTVPVVPTGGLLTLNARVATAHGSGSYVIFQDTQQVPAVSSTSSTVASSSPAFTYELSNHI